MLYWKRIGLFLLSLLVVLATTEFLSYLLLARIGSRSIEFKNYKDFKSKYEILSNISSYKRPRQPVEIINYAAAGKGFWPTHILVNGVHQLKPNSEGVFKRMNPDGTLMYEYHVAADEFGRRKTSAKKASKHLLVMGCSYVFGEGLEQQDTIPEIIQELTTDFRAYNLAASGYTIDEIYLRAKEQNFMGGVSQEEGVAIYVVMADHIRRSFGAMRDDWRLEKVKLVEKTEYNFEAEGFHIDDLKGLQWFFYYYANSNFARLFDLDYPFVTSKRVEIFVRKIKALEILYKKQLGGQNRLYVALYPDLFDTKTRYYLRLYLDKYGIAFVDYSKFNVNQFLHPLPRLADGHPNGKANHFLAKLLTLDLQLNSISKK